MYTLIAPQNVAPYWPTIGPWLVQAVGPLCSIDDLEYIKQAAQAGNAYIWISHKDTQSEIEMILVGEVVFYAGQRALVLRWCCGQGSDEWIPDIGFLEMWAKTKGFTRIEIWGRKAWEKLLKPHGYTFQYAVLGRDIDRGLH